MSHHLHTRIVRRFLPVKGETRGPGADAYLYTEVQLHSGATQQVVVRTDGRRVPRRGDVLGIEAIAHHLHLFDPETGERLSY